MNLSYKKVKILENEEVVSGIFKMVVEEENSIRAGQFYMLKHEGATLLPRPISICKKEGNELTFLYAVIGKGTKEFSNLRKGEEISVTGPLGNGFNIDNLGQKVALVGGGIGIAPLLQLAREIKEKTDSNIDFYGGYRDEVYLIDEIKEYVNEVKVSTNSGSYGHKGFVTDLLMVENYDVVLCCGPEIMMKKVVEMCKEKNVKVFVSMEKHMACGVGACLVCTCKTKEGMKRTCKDGPVFDGYSVEL